MTTAVISTPSDFHGHYREHGDGDLLTATAPYSMRVFGYGLAMPNTCDGRFKDGLVNAELVCLYRQHLQELAQRIGARNFQPIVPLKIVDWTTPDTILRASLAGVIAVKAYPVGATTNSSTGVTDFFTHRLCEVWRAMEYTNMVLCVHAEVPDGPLPLREERFIPTLEKLVGKFPRLNVLVEHVTSRAMVRAVRRLPANVGCTITAHHLMLTSADVGLNEEGMPGGPNFQPHNYCLPVAKSADDREALWEAVETLFEDDEDRVIFGSDNAPHVRERKEKQAKAGCATFPVIMPLLATLFELRFGKPKYWARLLTRFTSESGQSFYRLPPAPGYITLERRPMVVPSEIHGIVPFLAGQTLPWSVQP